MLWEDVTWSGNVWCALGISWYAFGITDMLLDLPAYRGGWGQNPISYIWKIRFQLKIDFSVFLNYIWCGIRTPRCIFTVTHFKEIDFGQVWVRLVPNSFVSQKKTLFLENKLKLFFLSIQNTLKRRLAVFGKTLFFSYRFWTRWCLIRGHFTFWQKDDMGL